MTKVTISEKQLVNEYGSGYGLEVMATVEDGDRYDGIDALISEYGEEEIWNHQGDVWNQFNWSVEVK